MLKEEEEDAIVKKFAMKDRIIRRGRHHDVVDHVLEVPIFMEEEGDEVKRKRTGLSSH